jgi:citrate lyase subunit beta/citryl-CoA lyase
MRHPDSARRSLLFVPGAETRKLERARDAAADVLILDLEDSVAPAQKSAARQQVAEAIRAQRFGASEVAVRINAPGSDEFAPDLEAMTAAGARLIVLPKAESREDIANVSRELEALETRHGVPASHALRLLALVESAAGIVRADSLGQEGSRLEALCFGHADFSLDMGLADADASRGVVFHARCALAIAARACGLAAVDSVHLAVKDAQAFREDAILGMSLGFDGKLCIHPAQVAIANEVYTPTSAQVECALRVLDAWEQARAEGRGVFSVDGRMVDAPVVAAQRRVVERARRAGRLPSGEAA